MKIGIVTWYEYNNYGTVLQATALTNYLKGKGHTVKIINYKAKGKIYGFNPLDTVYVRIKEIIKIYFLKKTYSKTAVSNDAYNTFRKQYYDLSTPVDCDWTGVEEEFDKIICGSDQIWSPLCFDENYYLKNITSADKKIAYAPSLGVDEVKNLRIKKRIIELINSFSYLSIREKQGKSELSKYTNKEIVTVVDPTLLLDKTQWMKLLNIKSSINEKYLLIYFLGNRKENWAAAYEIAKKKQLPVKIVPIYNSDMKREGVLSNGVSPKEFVSLIFNAEYVCTDSFHGMVFSIIGNIQFKVLKRHADSDWNNQNSRIDSLLDDLEIMRNAEKIDYEIVMQKLGIIVNESKEYLEKAVYGL